MFKKFFPLLIGLWALCFASSCSKNEEVRMPGDIVGIWQSASGSRYMELSEEYYVRNLQIEYQDGESIGDWTTDAYLYEPGYHIVIYLTVPNINVYQIVDLSDDKLTWCWVEHLEIDDSSDKDTIGHLIGDIIKKAQEGFNLNPELYESFRKISQDEFFSILESLDIMYPWFP